MDKELEQFQADLLKSVKESKTAKGGVPRRLPSHRLRMATSCIPETVSPCRITFRMFPSHHRRPTISTLASLPSRSHDRYDQAARCRSTDG